MKIIKRNAAGTLQVERFSFDGDSTDVAPADGELPAWMNAAWGESSGAPEPRQRIAESSPQRKGSIDLAQIEQTAYESGFLQGEKAGLEIAEKKTEVLMRRYSEAIVELGKLRTQLYAQVEREVVKLALEVAKKIVHREIQADREIIQTLVKVALSHVAEKSAVTVHLHPTDYNFLIERRAELFHSVEPGREIVLLADKSIDRGGCLIQTECGDIDARIEEEFREVERGFFEGKKSADHE